MNSYIQTNPIRSGPAWSRPEFLFTGTAVMLLTGVLIPWPDRVLDILWICQLSLAAAVLAICASARSSSQLDGFPPLLAATSFLSLLGTAGCMRAIVLRQDACGRLIRGLGDALTALEPLLALILMPVLGFFILYLVTQSGRRIRQAIEHYLVQILPFKKIGLETDQNLNILTRQQAETLLEKIEKEVRLYASMNGLRKLMTAQIAVNLFLVLASALLAWAGQSIQAAAEQTGTVLETLAAGIAGTAVVSWVPVGAVAAACGALLNKESLALPRNDAANEQNGSRKIHIVSSVSGRPEEVELLNPDSLSDLSQSQKPTEKIVHFEPQPPASPPQAPASKIRTINIRCKTSAQYYQSLEKLFTHPCFRSAFLILTAESVEDLPVTVAVHPAVQLARKKQTVLLIDADLQRHAAARVFSMDPQTLCRKPSPVPRINSLKIQCLMDQRPQSLLNIQNQEDDIACRIVYAPQGQWMWTRHEEWKMDKTKVLFFSSKTPEQIRALCPEAAAAGAIFLIPSLHKAISQASTTRPSAVE